MTVHTTNRASRHLAFDSLERVRAPDQITYRLDLRLWVDMIELQNDRISFSAIDARVRMQVLDCIRAVAGYNPTIRFKAFFVVLWRII
jgi:hypothetical protein